MLKCMMPRRFTNVFLCISVAILCVLLNSSGHLLTPAQPVGPEESTVEASASQEPAQVILGGEELLTIQPGVGALSPQDRAQAITNRLVESTNNSIPSKNSYQPHQGS